MSRQLEGLDSAFLAVETNAAHMHMTGLATLEPNADNQPATFDAIRAHLAPRLDRLAVFRLHLEEVPLGLGRPTWVERDFELDAHLHRIAVPSPGSTVELAEVVGHLAGLPLDRERPLWDIWVIEGLDRGRTAILAKLHHALLDGVAGAEIFARLFDFDPNAPAIDSDADIPVGTERAPSKARLLFDAAQSLVTLPYRIARQSARSTAAAARGLRAAPAPGEETKSSRLPIAPETPVNGAITARRQVALDSASLERLRQLKDAFDVTLNDVVLAVCAGALRRYLIESEGAPDSPLVAAVPVSVAPDTNTHVVGNRVSAMIVELPAHLSDPVGRLTAVRRSTLRAKRAHRAIGGELLARWADVAPPALLSALSGLYSRLDLADHHRPLVNLVVSNVPGPRTSLYCAGHRVEACYPMGPIYESCALNLTVLSYDDRLHFGLLACPDVVPDLERLVGGLSEAVEELWEAARSRPRRRAGRSARPRRLRSGPPQRKAHRVSRAAGGAA